MNLDEWHDLFVAGAGAGSALAGLIIVAVSVNISRILEIAGMTSRAAITVAGLTLIVVVTCAGLIPEQSAWVLGLEITIASLIAFVLGVNSTRLLIRVRAPEIGTGRALTESGLGLVPIATMLVGGLLLCADLEAGLYVVSAAIILGFAGSVTNAWVLLVEILR